MHIPNAVDHLHTEIARLQYALADSQRTVQVLQNHISALETANAAWQRAVDRLTAAFVDPDAEKDEAPAPKQPPPIPDGALKAPTQQPIGLPTR